MSAAENQALEAEEPLAEAARWRLLGLLLERPREEWRQDLSALGAESAVHELRELAAEACAAAEPAYLGVLGPGGVVSPRQAAYATHLDPGRMLAELRAIYDAFAYRPRIEDPHDHIAVEAGFVAYLFFKWAFARERSDSAAESLCQEALHAFLRTHLGAFVGELAERLGKTPLPYLAQATQHMAGRVARYGIRTTGRAALPVLGPPPGPPLGDQEIEHESRIDPHQRTSPHPPVPG